MNRDRVIIVAIICMTIIFTQGDYNHYIVNDRISDKYEDFQDKP